jgi:adenylylsulfate kinase
VIVWLTGLSSAGKSTIAQALKATLQEKGYRADILDGDEVRRALGGTLGFSREDRNANVLRIGYIANLLSKNGVITIVAMISPYREARDTIRTQASKFVEVFVNAPLMICEARDVKGLYKKARSGAIQNFTGISDPYEPPLDAEVECMTDRENLEECVGKILAAIEAVSMTTQFRAH